MSYDKPGSRSINPPGAEHERIPDSPPGFRSGFAAIIGRANVGKSTLLNQLIGEKLAIVSAVPQTTRQRILGVRTTDRGQIAFLDSPGFHKPKTRLGDFMNEQARSVAGEADVVLFVVDASDGLGPGDRYVLEQLDPKSFGKPVIAVFNKTDQMNKGRVLPMIELATSEWGCAQAVPLSAETGDNVDALLEVVIDYLPEGPMLFPVEFRTDQQLKGFVAEIVREKLLHKMRQEVPHSIAVLIDGIEERDDGVLEIHASIIVERDSQKGIVIGKGGEMLKKIGTQARRELEERFDTKVFLKLWVKVRSDWRDRIALLRELGTLPG